ncbi:MAG: ABC transporter permease subunit [Desulfovibrio sp.]
MINLKKSILTSLWFMFLTFPLLVIRVDTIENTVVWRWENLLLVGVGSLICSTLWQYMMKRREARGGGEAEKGPVGLMIEKVINDKRLLLCAAAGALAVAVAFPLMSSMYATNIMISALIYIVLGLGLNIVVGLAGLLDLGYVAFYAVGAYAYALLNLHFGLGFWAVLPIGGFLAFLFGIALGFPVLRLRGDYLAIVTLGFGEIIRLVLENWSDFSQGPSGVAGIDRPTLFGMKLGIADTTIYVYYIMIAMVIFTIFVVNRLKNSRMGRAWIALREDEIACQAMGINRTKTKLRAFALGAAWAGFVGVVFAAKTTFINPASFTFLESAIILSIVVLGGMGSILGVILGAALMILLPELLRDFAEYRMLIFGATMVLVMVFRPQGLVKSERKQYNLDAVKKAVDGE